MPARRAIWCDCGAVSMRVGWVAFSEVRNCNMRGTVQCRGTIPIDPRALQGAKQCVHVGQGPAIGRQAIVPPPCTRRAPMALNRSASPPGD